MKSAGIWIAVLELLYVTRLSMCYYYQGAAVRNHILVSLRGPFISKSTQCFIAKVYQKMT